MAHDEDYARMAEALNRWLESQRVSPEDKMIVMAGLSACMIVMYSRNESECKVRLSEFLLRLFDTVQQLIDQMNGLAKK